MKEKESQSIEWKEVWQDEYLKWICGYANAYGGILYIGTDDDGNVVGIDNARELLERIPNKITDTMGIIADVNLLYSQAWCHPHVLLTTQRQRRSLRPAASSLLSECLGPPVSRRQEAAGS